MGFLTNLLNPKVAVIYLSLLPQFIDIKQGSVLVQTLLLGSIQILISLFINFVAIVMAGSMATFFARRAFWLKCQRWLMGSVLAGLGIRMVFDN